VPGLIAKSMTFIAAPANDSVVRRRRFAVSALSVPAAKPPDRAPAGSAWPPASLRSLPFALAAAWSCAHLALWDRYVADSVARPLQHATGSSLVRLIGCGVAVNTALTAACIEGLADLGGAALDHGTARFRR
jgi:hypothetical protein